MRISDWSSDVCSSDLLDLLGRHPLRRWRFIKKGGAPGDFALEIVEQRLFRLIGISGEDVEGSRHLGIDTGKRDQFFISAAQLVFPSYCLDQRCRGGCDQLQGIDWNGHRPARPTKRSEEHTSDLQSLMRTSYADL